MLRLQYLVYFSSPWTLRVDSAQKLRVSYLCPDDSRWAAKLAQLDAIVAASTLARLSSSDATGHLAAELNRRNRNRENEYFRPFVWAGVWRDLRSRRKLQHFVREKLKLNDDEHRRFLAGIRTAARDEPQMRAIQLAMLLIEQAELAAQPLRPEELDRPIANERQRAENLRRAEWVDAARLYERHAAELARDHERDFRTEEEREKAMIRAAAKRLRDFCMRGDSLVAGLVSEALGREISPRRVRHVVIRRRPF